MKKFKKIIATLLVVLSFATLLAGCTKKTECDICEEVAKCKSKVKSKFVCKFIFQLC